MQGDLNRYRSFFGHAMGSFIYSYCKRFLISSLLLLVITWNQAFAVEYSANFKNIDIQEFINTVSKNLNKTIIIDPSVMGKINVRSYDDLNAHQYYQFFLSVLEVYGFSVITMDNGLLKVIPFKNVRGAAIPVASGKTPGEGDEVIIRVVPVHNVLARDMVPLLRQLSDSNGVGSVVHYDMSNMLLLTGRAEVVNNMMKVVQDIDKASDQTVVRIPLEHASASDVAKMITILTREDMPGMSRIPNGQFIRVVADERTNSLLVSGEEKARQRVVDIVHQLDKDAQSSNTKVIFLKYAKATSLLSVLTGSGSGSDSQNKNDSFAASVQNTFGNQGQGGGFSPGGNTGMGGGIEQGNGQGQMMPGPMGQNNAMPPGFGLGGGGGGQGSGISLLKNATIKADEDNNALIVTAPPDVLRDIENVINQLDVRRAQVLVEAVIVEVQDADGLNLGVQWFNRNHGGTNFPDTNASIINMFNPTKDNPSPTFANAVSKINGFAAGFYHGNWAALLTALSTDSKNDILATPSVVTVDNAVANLSVGQDVPVLTGTQSNPTGSTSDNVFSSVSRRTVGIKLLVKPQINTGDSVMLQIAQEVSSVADTTPTGTQNLGASFNTRTVNNTVLVKSGETVVIGGILDNNVTDKVSKVPLLGDIPGIGALFRSTSKQSTKRNLMLFIRPTIIRDNDNYQEQSVRQYSQFNSVYQDELHRNPDKLPTQLNQLQTQQRSREAFDRVQKNINQFYATE